jgi:hypothetical protein
MSKMGKYVFQQQNDEFFCGFDRLQGESSSMIDSEAVKRFLVTINKLDGSFMSYEAIGRRGELLNAIYDKHGVCGVYIKLAGDL